MAPPGGAAVDGEAHPNGLRAQHIAAGIARHGLEIEGLRNLCREGTAEQSGNEEGVRKRMDGGFREEVGRERRWARYRRW